MTDIIIPTFGQEDFTVKCLESIRKHTKSSDYRIIWVDNGSSRSSRFTVLSEIEKHNYLSIWLPENVGFVKATNAGIEASSAEYLCLMNNDTEATGDWLNLLLEPLKSHGFMASGPMTSTEGSWQGWRNVREKMLMEMPDLAGIRQDAVSSLLNKRYHGVFRSVQMVAFFCTVFNRGVFDKLGKLDELFKVGFGDDDDYCKRIKDSGGEIAFVPASYVCHHHRTTFKAVYGMEKVKQMQSENLALYKEKHNL